MRRRGERGQASIELLAMVPLVILAALLAWQLTAVLAAGLEAQERVRARALRVEGGAATIRVVTVSVRRAAGPARRRRPAPDGPRRRADAVRGRRAAQGGQAAPLALAVGALLVLGAVALFTLGRVQLAAAQAQTAADLAAISAGRELRAHLGDIAIDGPAGAARWRARLAAVSDAAARPAGARLESLRIPDGAWPPTAVEVVVSHAGPRGSRVRAVARAGVVAAAAGAAGPATGWARGGGYSGPLVHRDGKPMCPVVGAAFDLMDAAAHADGVDLVVTSGFRSDAEQAVLFARHPDPKWVAPPGRSRHRDATELDLNMGAGGAAHAWLARNATRFGFVQRYSWEPWHYGYAPGLRRGRAARGRPARAPERPCRPGSRPACAPRSPRPRRRTGSPRWCWPRSCAPSRASTRAR